MEKIILARFSRQSEPVRLRKIILLRARTEIRLKIIREAKLKGVSINVILNNLLEKEFKDKL